MKYWCYYANVVRYLEKVEALFAPKTRGPAYLVWTDEDGPHMIAGPGIHWYRGDGPMPDLDSLEIPVSITAPIRAPTAREGSACAQSTPKKKLRAARVSKRLPANPQSTRPARECRPATWRKPPATRVEPPAHHSPETSIKPAIQPQESEQKANNFFETRSNLLTKEPDPRTFAVRPPKHTNRLQRLIQRHCILFPWKNGARIPTNSKRESQTRLFILRSFNTSRTAQIGRS